MHERTRGLRRWLTMQSSTADANCYDFIGNGRKREERSRRWQLANCFSSSETIRARIVLFHLWSTPLWRGWIFTATGEASCFSSLRSKSSGIYRSPRLVVPRPSLSASQTVRIDWKFAASIASNSQGWEFTVVCRRDPEYGRKSPTPVKRVPKVLPKRDCPGIWKPFRQTKRKGQTAVGISIYRIFLVWQRRGSKIIILVGRNIRHILRTATELHRQFVKNVSLKYKLIKVIKISIKHLCSIFSNSRVLKC